MTTRRAPKRPARSAHVRRSRPPRVAGTFVYRHQVQIVVGAVAAMIGLGLAIPLWRSLGAGTTTTETPSRPPAYRISYTDSLNGSPQWEVLAVRRPFESADLVYATAGPPAPTDRPTSGSVSTEDRLYDVDPAGLHDVGGRQPGPPSGDQDLATQLPAMLRRGLASDTGQVRRVAGRSCHLYRFFEPPVGPIRRLAGPSEHDDLCLDGDGLVLAESWTHGGQVVMRRTATLVSLSDVSIPRPTAPSPPAGNASRISQATGQGDLLEQPAPPAGYRPIPPVQFSLPDPQSPRSVIAASVVWAFVRGADVVTVEAGREHPGQLPWRADDTVTRPVQLPGLGPARSAIRSDSAEVRVDLGGGAWVRVHGTIPLARLTDYADKLQLARPAAGTSSSPLR